MIALLFALIILIIVICLVILGYYVTGRLPEELSFRLLAGCMLVLIVLSCNLCMLLEL